MGVGVYCASDYGGYFYKSGTSLSTPLIAGGAAMVLQANPGMRGNPMTIRERLMLSADRYTHPDNRYGHGIPDLAIAAGFGINIHEIPEVIILPGRDTTLSLVAVGPPAEPVTWDAISIPVGGLFDGFANGEASLYFVAENDNVGSRNYLIAASAGGYTDTLDFTVTILASTHILSVGPNPCHDELNINVAGDFPDGFKIEIFSLSGDIVFRAFSHTSRLTWNTTNESGENVASGLYIIRFSADGIEEKAKIFKL
jgi:hypothetical protein